MIESELSPDKDSAKPAAATQSSELVTSASKTGDITFPVVEVTFPPTLTAANPEPHSKPRSTRSRRILITALVFLIAFTLLLTGFGSYTYGYNQGHSVAASVATGHASTAALVVPKGATIIEQCSVGRGTQYVLPSNIPHGPVFNVYQGKVIGVEYMIGQADLANNNSFYALPLYGKTYDHVDIGLQSKGHTGYPEVHYHVDIYNISRAASAAITCK